MNINENDRKEINGCMKMKEELIQNNDSICIKRTIPLFSEEEIKNIDENFISIVNEYSKMLVKEKEQKTIQLLLKKQNEEIERLIISLQAQEELTMNEHIKVERLNNIINELEKWLEEKQELSCGCGITIDYIYAYENVLNELKDLKNRK